MFENPRRGRQVRNFTANVPKIIESSSEHIFSENWRWVPLTTDTHVTFDLVTRHCSQETAGDCAQSYFRIPSWNPYMVEKLSFLFFPQYLLFSQPAIVVIGLANPTSISVFEDFIYWVEENSIERANKEVRSPGQPNRGMELKNANDTVKSLKVVSGNIQKGEFLIKLVTNRRYFS